LALEGLGLPNMQHEEPSVIGDVYVTILGLQGLPGAAEVHVCLELDAYGHFFRKATTDTLSVRAGVDPFWGQEFAIELEGSHAMRILLYCCEQTSNGALSHSRMKVIGKYILELNKSSLNDKINSQERVIPLSSQLKLGMKLRFISSEMTLRRAPSAKPCGLFGVKLALVCKREKRTIPFVVTCCLREVERRGCRETGIYRVSGSASDVQKLRKSFESSKSLSTAQINFYFNVYIFRRSIRSGTSGENSGHPFSYWSAETLFARVTGSFNTGCEISRVLPSVLPNRTSRKRQPKQ
jgi:hypothetical protein